MKIRLAAALQSDSIVDGPGIRTVIWTQGCPHHCRGCHNPSTHSFEDGELIPIEDICKEIDNLQNQDGITFSGGDPMCQAKACYHIAKYAKEKGLDIWCYTGYTFEELLEKKDKDINNFLSVIDVLIDGKFILKEKSLNLRFKGSKNQRTIDVKKSLEENKICLLEEIEDISLEKPKYMYI